ncbi:MAG: copper chaperone PCu(A)C [Sulfitobacter sp.]
MKRLLVAASAALLTLSAPAFAQNIMIKDAYVRSSTPSSPTGAAFMMLMNESDSDDRLISVASDVAARVQLHTHIEDANGVMKMTEIEGGIPIAAGETHMMQRGGDHVMFMGLKAPLEQGGEITVTLTFEKAGDVKVTIPVDSERKPGQGSMKHGN